MIKLFSRTYTIRFMLAHHLATPEYLEKEITDFCNENNLELHELVITNDIEHSPNSATLIKTSFVSINGNKKDYELLRDFLQKFHDNSIIIIMTV